MPNFAGVLKSEIRRLARKEIRASVTPLRRMVTSMRRRIAEQRKLIAEMERLAKRSASAIGREAAVRSGADDRQIRFSPQWVKAHRKKLKMSRREYAKLVGVSAQSIFGWETGRTRPRRRALESWRKLRSMGAREARALLDRTGPGRGGRRGRKAGGRKARRAGAAAGRGRKKRGRTARAATRRGRRAKKK